MVTLERHNLGIVLHTVTDKSSTVFNKLHPWIKIFQGWPVVLSVDVLTLLHSAALSRCYTPNAFGNQSLGGNVKSCKLILVDSERPIRFPYAWLHRRRNWWGRAVVFTSAVMDWVTPCRPRMVPLWRGPLCSPHRLQSPCMTGRYCTSALWTGPSALTPYPEPSFPWASSYSTSSTGSPIKCCDTRTSMRICKKHSLPTQVVTF